ncbi:NusG domain II-containing protein [Acidaminobacter hydrogenoformans]|uniref:Uncharacterized protein n=1 Tax=Acidaminobacter hydrogenoformans DSM 2784 TaxID=1120920 RepID=A0A1G5RQN6_9FIRM|nr:NusG domain II-containing protein [Acidaminobacter hydrogenoformans]SCZ76317.1 hypothetical protein SAMN03080599_00177 [Acidaminobacter hydrogenoformans DSM 2784]
MKKTDIILIVVLAVVALGALGIMKLVQGRAAQVSDAILAEIVVEGELYKTVDLSVPQVIEIRTEKGYNFLKIENGQILMFEADCRDQICVNTAPADQPGDTIVCLPHEVVVQIKGTAEGGLDAIAQ